ncbi:MAG: OmpA family protein [Micropruina sp.]
MRTFVRAHRRPLVVSALAAVVLMAGCTESPAPGTLPAPSAPGTSPAPSASSEPSGAPGSPSAAAAGSGEAASYGVDPAVVAEVQALCAAGPGKTVEHLPDVTIPALTWPGVAALDVPATDRPATTAESGCLVTFDAPAGCLPAATISAGWIPGYRIEGFSYPDGQGDTVTVAPLEADAVVAPAASVEQSCQVETSGEYVRAVYRRAIFRRAAFQRAAYRRGSYRRAGGSLQAVTIPGLTVPGVTLPGATLKGATLPGRRITKDVSAVGGRTAAAYTAPEAVLFEYNKSVLRRSAAKSLDAILADARAKGFTGKVRVEGHTDDTGDQAANQRLSEARAQAVADYLVTKGIAAGRITVTGRGESAPAYPNNSTENRAKNRRVVIEFRVS